MGKLIIDKDACPENHCCPAVDVCPTGALTQVDFQAPEVDYDVCIACGLCADVCPRRALMLSDDD